MRLPDEAWHITWHRWLAEVTPPAPLETSAPTAWELTQEFLRDVRKFDNLRRPQRRPRHQRRP